jgi:phage-related protein
MKKILFHKRADKEFMKFPIMVRKSFAILIKYLGDKGLLSYPKARKITGYKNLFEMRVKDKTGIYRGFYFYFNRTKIKVLSFFKKKSHKTPIEEIKKALSRI